MSDPHPLDLPEVVAVSKGVGDLAKICVTTPWSTAEIYQHGAHVTGFRINGEEPLLFLSGSSEFMPGKPIRGGIPIIFPWFGGRDGCPAHGFARTVEWEFTARSLLPDGSVRLWFRMPAAEGYEVIYTVTVGESLSLELDVRNSGDVEVSFETCLHTYFKIGDIDTVSIHGLTGCTYLDKVSSAVLTETTDPIRISSEVDRVYPDTTTTVEIIDPTLGRKIRVAKSGSNSTVVWNPWIAKSKRMEDFGDDEYLTMVCVESGNVADDRITLPPGGHAVLKVDLGSGKLG